MMSPLTDYFASTVKDFDQLFSSVFDGALSEDDINNLGSYITRSRSLSSKKVK